MKLLYNVICEGKILIRWSIKDKVCLDGYRKMSVDLY